MFTGIIEVIGRADEVRPTVGGVRLAIDAGTLDPSDIVPSGYRCE